ncbi:Nitrate/nitrite sensor protein [hydrothermal vent metagenome]|uniref:Oxygen sensor histidine kinase NreB n=1 Tax=hydrothermal vent metagenome TaxID=652676 RepID=A0A3B1B4V3_9ZZZZ
MSSSISEKMSSTLNQAAGERLAVEPTMSSLSHLKLETGILLFLIIALLLTGLLTHQIDSTWFTALFVSIGGLASALLIHLYLQLNKPMNQSLLSVNKWAADILEGRLQARIPALPLNENNPFERRLRKNINNIGGKLENLTHNMNELVEQHLEDIEQKDHTLEIVYDVAASINSSRDLDELLTRFLSTLTNVVNARAAVVRLITDDGQMRLISSLGLDEELMKKEQLLPSEQCLCGSAYREDEVFYQKIGKCDKIIGRAFFDSDDIGMIAVPLQYRDKTLGVYNLFVENSDLPNPEDMTILLTNIGRHLGMAIDKARSDNESKRLSIMEERTRLAHELHDSLAQTLASLRFQVRVLDETLRQGQEPEIWSEMEKIENNLDEAYAELRELITHFRAPIDKRGLIPAVEHLVDRFRNQCEISIFLQKDWNVLQLPASIEMQALRIIQESLNNIRKHSQAHAVRVFMRSDTQGDCSILIEDDGVGMNIAPKSDRTSGDHLGLSIMEERAKRFGGTVQIESEPGEGTRIFLHFHYPEISAQDTTEINVQAPVK